MAQLDLVIFSFLPTTSVKKRHKAKEAGTIHVVLVFYAKLGIFVLC